MASIASCIYRIASNAPLMLRLAYTISEFKPPADQIDNNAIGRVHSMFGGLVRYPRWPRKSIVGLGYEKGKALGAIEYLQLDAEFMWIPNASDTRFIEAVERPNSELLAGEGRRIDYNVLDPHTTLIDLLSLINELKRDSNPVLLPFGPKMFFFLCLLTSMGILKLQFGMSPLLHLQIIRMMLYRLYLLFCKCRSTIPKQSSIIVKNS